MLLSTMLYFPADPLNGLFTKDEAIVRGVKNLLLTGIFMEPFSAGIMILLGSLRSAGDAVVPVVFSIALTWLVGLPLAWLFITQMGMGVNGLWIALAITESLKCAGLFLRWQRTKWAVTVDVLTP